MRVLVTPNYRTLSTTAAELVAKAVESNPSLVLGLPTGNTPLGMYDDLVKRNVDFSQVSTFNLDEYAGLSADDPHSYRTYMRERFFDHVNIAISNTHFPVELGDYDKAIAQAGGIDLLIVGIGANGHIAFNEPGSRFDSRTRVVDLAPDTIERALQHFPAGAQVPRKAVTMGIATILDARRILLLASGSAKAEVVRRALHGPISESMPASALQKHPQVIAIVDEAAGT